MKYSKKVGIKDFGLYIPPFRVNVDSLAKHLGASDQDIDKLRQLIGNHREFSTADSTYMDSVVLGLNAVSSLDNFGDIGLILSGTESAPDKSKPTMALVIQDEFDLNKDAQVLQNSAACCVGANMLLSGINYSSLTFNNTLIAIADIARYDPQLKNAYKKIVTQGSGGAAFVIGENPIIEFCKPGLEGSYSKLAKDFWVPDGAKYPEVDGLMSCFCYDLGVIGAVQDHFRKLDDLEGQKSVKKRLEEYDLVVIHVPFVNQAREAFGLLYHSAGFGELEYAVENELENKKQVFEIINKSKTNLFDQVCGSWQQVPKKIGNSYSVSLPASLIYALQQQDKAPLEALLVFFGSGMQSIAISAKVHQEALQRAKQINIDLNDKTMISPGQYLKNLRLETSFGMQGKFKKTKVQRGYPEYEKI
ncbi:MAG: hypothetical protein MAG795_00131 [Candidatus Woesearchaeota archaeon]|nr:hypothetical protein [Candidatus Woesearchaeota archaeon]